MLVSFKDLQDAFEFVCAASGGEHQAFLCKQSGRIYCHSELADDLDPLRKSAATAFRSLRLQGLT